MGQQALTASCCGQDESGYIDCSAGHDLMWQLLGNERLTVESLQARGLPCLSSMEAYYIAAATRRQLASSPSRESRARGNAERLREAGLLELFGPEQLRGRRAVAVWSLSDKACSEQRFQEKEVEVLTPPGMEEQHEALLEWLQALGVGWTCKKGYKVDTPNQDSFAVVVVEGCFMLLGVFDGHGHKGHDLSQFARQQAIRHFVGHPKRGSDPEAALADAIRHCHALMEEGVDELRASHSGSTCTLLYLDLSSFRLSVAHVGDSRAVLGRSSGRGAPYEATDLTADHKPELPEERRRIECAKPPGRVVHDGFTSFRVCTWNSLKPALNMSRSLGDVWAHQACGISSMPDAASVELEDDVAESGPKQLALLLCSDGVWQFLRSEEALRIVAAREEDEGVSGAAHRLALESWIRWMSNSAGEACDDITAVVVYVDTVRRPTSPFSSSPPPQAAPAFFE